MVGCECKSRPTRVLRWVILPVTWIGEGKNTNTKGRRTGPNLRRFHLWRTTSPLLPLPQPCLLNTAAASAEPELLKHRWVATVRTQRRTDTTPPPPCLLLPSPPSLLPQTTKTSSRLFNTANRPPCQITPKCLKQDDQ